MLPVMPTSDQPPKDRANWTEFLGPAVHAYEVPRFDELLRVARANRPNLPIWLDARDRRWSAAIDVLSPFREILTRFKLNAKLIELTLVHDLADQPADSGKRSFASFAASYASEPLARHLINAYDAAIARITAKGHGEAILGHPAAYDHSFLLVPPHRQADGTTREYGPEAFGRIREFPYDEQKSVHVGDPIEIPTELMRLLRQSVPETAGWGFALYPFRRPTVTDSDVSADPYIPQLFDAPGGILFVLCEDLSQDFQRAVEHSAWAMHLLIDKALLLEARDERRVRYRQDTALLFHVLLSKCDVLCGTAELEFGDDHVVCHGIAQLKDLAKIMKDAMSRRNGLDPEPPWEGAPTESLAAFAARIQDLTLSAYRRELCLALGDGCADSLQVRYRPELLQLLIPEIADNADKYGDGPLFCRLFVDSDLWIKAAFTNALRAPDTPENLEEKLAKRDSYLGFLQLTFASEAYETELPQFKLANEEASLWRQIYRMPSAHDGRILDALPSVECFRVTAVVGRCIATGGL